ncbi:SH3 domain-containing protein [Streptomyces albofaciens JCM 4342]|uniref:SH3 domain-containing protein n=1 Tax=Streptomyces albofaciens TaxID=66866 RepID=UPI0012399AB9|nr:SH3 domain-containing protein [Streptomyces albofaciens]KAA6212934.1 SH3 domain-containing protein [Streptomyces albofaciens JCM 4342]
MRRTAVTRTIAKLAVATAATGSLLATTGAAHAAAQPQRSAAPAHAARQAAAQVCTVNDNGVNFRGGPGENFPVLGQVNAGQKLNVRGRQGNWVMGDLWGGRTGVWIHIAYLNC